LPTLRSLAALAAAFPALSERADGGRTTFSSSPLDAADVFGTLLTSFDTAAGAPAAPPRQGRRATRRSTQQQDAHEFLDRLLDTAHAVRMRAAAGCAAAATCASDARRAQELLLLRRGAAGATPEAAAAGGAAAEAEAESWECVGRRQKSYVARSHESLVAPDAASPISDIFGAGTNANAFAHAR
jgi:hypothetical protein